MSMSGHGKGVGRRSRGTKRIGIHRGVFSEFLAKVTRSGVAKDSCVKKEGGEKDTREGQRKKGKSSLSGRKPGEGVNRI